MVRLQYEFDPEARAEICIRQPDFLQNSIGIGPFVYTSDKARKLSRTIDDQKNREYKNFQITRLKEIEKFIEENGLFP